MRLNAQARTLKRRTSSYLFAFCLVALTLLPSCSNTPLAPATGTLAIEAGIVYKFGGSQPVGRNEFRLLNRSLAVLLAEARWTLEYPDEQPDVIADWAIVRKHPRGRTAALSSVENAIDQHTVQAVMTDFNGKAEFANVSPGSYFLFGVTDTRSGQAIWDLPIEIKAGQNSTILDQNNAASVY